jgi:hypothetical protein
MSITDIVIYISPLYSLIHLLRIFTVRNFSIFYLRIGATLSSESFFHQQTKIRHYRKNFLVFTIYYKNTLVAYE